MRALVLVALVLGLTGCGVVPDHPEVDEANYGKIDVEGTTCVVARGRRTIAIDCNWEKN